MSIPPPGLTPDELLNWQLRDRLASNLNVHRIPANANETMARLVGKVQLIGRPTLDPLRHIGYGFVDMHVATTNVLANTATAASLIPLLNNDDIGTHTFTATPPTPAAAVLPEIQGFDRLDLVRGYTLVGWESFTATFGTQVTQATVAANALGTVIFTNFDTPSLTWTVDNVRVESRFAAAVHNSIHAHASVTTAGVLSIFVRRSPTSNVTYHWRGLMMTAGAAVANLTAAQNATSGNALARLRVALFG